jgi:hypothetical protein
MKPKSDRRSHVTKEILYERLESEYDLLIMPFILRGWGWGSAVYVKV